MNNPILDRLRAVLHTEMVSRLLKNITTGIDGSTFDFGRILGIAGGVFFIVAGIHQVLISTPEHGFDFMGYGTGFGLMATGIGACIGIKSHTEPQKPAEPKEAPKS